MSKDPQVDPLGACVGPNGDRVNAVVNELSGEKVDIVVWNEQPDVYIAAALSPAQVLRVDVDPENFMASVTVPENQLSLAIGKDGGKEGRTRVWRPVLPDIVLISRVVRWDVSSWMKRRMITSCLPLMTKTIKRV